MNTIDVIQNQSNRNQSVRLLMLLIIAATFPFYCFAVWFIGSAPPEGYVTAVPHTASPAPSLTPLGANLVSSPAAADGLPAYATFTPLSLPISTPAQFIPPTAIPLRTTLPPTLHSPSPRPTLAPPTLTPRPTSAIADADFDGVADDDDRCPSDFGYADNQGCPYADDADRDGIRDAADACPQEFAPDSPRGCRDFDDDGLDTAADECPNQAGPLENQGCPISGGNRDIPPTPLVSDSLDAVRNPEELDEAIYEFAVECWSTGLSADDNAGEFEWAVLLEPSKFTASCLKRRWNNACVPNVGDVFYFHGDRQVQQTC